MLLWVFGVVLLSLQSAGVAAAPLASYHDDTIKRPAIVAVGWYYPPPDLGPPTISSLSELDALGPYVAPIIYGGVGNVLFQLATSLILGKELGVPSVFGYFEHWNQHFRTFYEWGGHPAPAPGVTLKMTFPALRWMTVRPRATANTVANEYAYNIQNADDFLALPTRDKLPVQLHGYFFNHRYWHHERDFLLDKLAINPAIEEYVQYFYGNLFAKETVSVHTRLGYAREPGPIGMSLRKLPHIQYFSTAIAKFDKARVRFVFFSDNIERTKEIFAPLHKRGFDAIFVDDNVIVSLRLMSMCTHHIMTSSTLSFWGAYLDTRQPSGGRTFFPASFSEAHGKNMIPYPEWEALPDGV